MDNQSMTDEEVLKRLTSLHLLERVKLRRMFNIGPVGKASCIELLMKEDRAQLIVDLTICDLLREHNIETAKSIIKTFWELFKVFAPAALGKAIPSLPPILDRLDTLVAFDGEDPHEFDFKA